MSRHETTFALHLRAHNIPYRREVPVCPGRRFRLDFAIGPIERRIAVEIEGGIWGRKSGHNTGKGILRDMEKGNLATKHGWSVYRFSGDQVQSGEAINFIREILEERAT